MSIYLDLPFIASLVALLTLPRISTWLDLHLRCHAKRLQIQLSWDLSFSENSALIWILSSFSPKVFLKLLSGAQPFFTLYSCFRQENIYLMQGVMQCMIVHEWNVRAFKFVFHLNSFCSSVLGFFAFLRPCVLYRPARLVYHASNLSLESIFSLDVFLSHHNFLCVRSLNVCDFSI